MGENSSRERDLVLAPNEYAFISDQTKGHIIVYVGPCKTSLANTDQPVFFNDQSKRFERCLLEQAIIPFAIAPEGWYIVLKNPARDSANPKTATSSNLPELQVGKKVNMPGPASFALWPGQMIRVVQGHHLRLNQYLLVRVYDERGAKENWKTAVIKPQTALPADGELAVPTSPGRDIGDLDLTMGKLLVIKGTEVSFYIPPTGIEVVRDPQGNYVREAVTLERLEYCILRDEDGNKRFIRGPAVVFPRPSETFLERNHSRKFRAIELNEISGLYVKVIAPYQEGGREYKVGEELFLTGKDQMIYFPRPEHAIIKYSDREIHYSVAIPAGEGRYVLDRLAGKISLIRGPKMFLADPRQEVIVRRVIDPKIVELWFPGNQEALEYNRRLKSLVQNESEAFVTETKVKKSLEAKVQKPGGPVVHEEPAEFSFAGDDFNRSSSFTQPRTITLDTKYEGAVAIDVWTGYAVLVVSKTGERKVIAGPQTHLMEYDENLEAIELSTGTPKNDVVTIKTVYMRTLHNKVSDLVEVETADLCQVKLWLSFRVNFEGPSEKWFDVENYVKFLTDHMRSVLRSALKQIGIEKFYADSISFVRNTILGEPKEDGKRPGRLFPENGMRVYDVEVLDVKIGDQAIEKLLVEAQHEVVVQTLQMNSERRRLEMTSEMETIKQKTAVLQAQTREKVEGVKQQIAKVEAVTKQNEIDLQKQEVTKQLELNLAKVGAEAEKQKSTLAAKLEEQTALGQINAAELARQKAEYELNLEVAQKQMQQRLEEVRTEVEAVAAKAKAVSPDLIAALQAFGDRALAEKMAETMAPLAIIGGKSLTDVFGQLLKGTPLEHLIKKELPIRKTDK